MVFSDPVFLFLFLPAALLVVAAAPRALRNVVLLAASLVFYAWGEQEIVFVMLASIAVNHVLALWMDRATARGAGPVMRKALLVTGIVFNLGVLVLFKYANWLWSEAQFALVALGVDAARTWTLDPIRLPIGVSFFTFQALSYVVDVYRERVPVRKSPLHFALYISLFPQLIAGPIVRYTDLADQIAERTVRRADLAEGLRRFVIGLGKKVLLADVLSRPVPIVFGAAPDELTAAAAWLGMFAFTLQVYFDFSGYSDMAIGLSRVFGFKLLENFRWPLISRSLTEFWRRWHISLSTWFRDYLFIPLGGSQRGAFRTYVNLWIVFFLCGLWHGASWNYVTWGLYHGVFLALERAGLGRLLDRAPRAVGHVYFLAVFMSGWLLFCTDGLYRAPEFARTLVGSTTGSHPDYTLPILLDPPLLAALIIGALGSTPAGYLFGRRLIDAVKPRWKPAYDGLEAFGLALVLGASLLMVAANGFQTFIYFRF